MTQWARSNPRCDWRGSCYYTPSIPQSPRGLFNMPPSEVFAHRETAVAPLCLDVLYAVCNAGNIHSVLSAPWLAGSAARLLDA